MSLRATKRRRRPRYWLRRLVLISLLLLPLLAYGGWRWLQSGLIAAEPGAASAPPIANTAEPIHVLVLGVDERIDQDDPGRSDTMILVRLSRTVNEAHAISIPRDTTANFRGQEERINTAYSVGGAELSAQAVSGLLNVPVPYFVKVNLHGFIEIIAYLGGIEMEVEQDFYYHDPYQDLTIDLKGGYQTLSGEQALHYVRLRYDGVANDDISRIGRQQRFMQAVRDKLLASPLKLPGLVGAARRHVTTNIPEQDQLTLATMLFEARQNLTLLTLPGEPDDDTGDWVFDRAAWQETIADWPDSTR